MPASIMGRSYVRVHEVLSGPPGMLARVEFYAAYVETSRVVHLTPASFLLEALCGEAVELDGKSDVPVICEDCDRLAREAGGDPDGWVAGVANVRLELRAAA